MTLTVAMDTVMTQTLSAMMTQILMSWLLTLLTPLTPAASQPDYRTGITGRRDLSDSQKMFTKLMYVMLVAVALGCKSKDDQIKGAKSEVENKVTVNNDEHLWPMAAIIVSIGAGILIMILAYCCARRLGLTRNLRSINRAATNTMEMAAPPVIQPVMSRFPLFQPTPMGTATAGLQAIRAPGLELQAAEVEMIQEMRKRDAILKADRG